MARSHLKRELIVLKLLLWRSENKENSHVRHPEAFSHKLKTSRQPNWSEPPIYPGILARGSKNSEAELGRALKPSIWISMLLLLPLPKVPEKQHWLRH